MTAGLLVTSSAVPSAIFSPKSITVMSSQTLSTERTSG